MSRKTTTQLGLKQGKSYVVARDPGNEDVIVGDTVVLEDDDLSHNPWVRVKRTGELRVIYAEAMDELKEVPLKNFIIDVTKSETTVKVGKLLSADQIKRIIEILGE